MGTRTITRRMLAECYTDGWLSNNGPEMLRKAYEEYLAEGNPKLGSKENEHPIRRMRNYMDGTRQPKSQTLIRILDILFEDEKKGDTSAHGTPWENPKPDGKYEKLMNLCKTMNGEPDETKPPKMEIGYAKETRDNDETLRAILENLWKLNENARKRVLSYTEDITNIRKYLKG